jgi:hypothetical protein
MNEFYTSGEKRSGIVSLLEINLKRNAMLRSDLLDSVPVPLPYFFTSAERLSIK